VTKTFKTIVTDEKKVTKNGWDKCLSLLLILLFLIFTPVLLTGQSLEWSGYTQVRYAGWDVERDGFAVKRSRAGLKGKILKNIEYKFQMDAVKTPVLLDAQIGIDLSPYAKLSIGQFKLPFSLENLTSSSDLDTVNRSLTVENLCPGRDIESQGRDIGITVNGGLSWIKYSLGLFNGSGINRTDYNNQKDVAGRLVFYFDNFFILGFSHYKGYYSAYPDASWVKRDRTGIDIFFVKGQISIKGEYILARDDKIERYGCYIQGGFYLLQETLQFVMKYDFLDKNNVQGDRIDVVTVAFNYIFSDKTRFQINYEYRREEKSGKISNNVILAQLQAGF
jgi:hypothetical protein